MSTLIKRMLCNHKWKQMNGITAVCENCGKIRNIPCCHKWEQVREVSVEGYSKDHIYRKYKINIYICKNCGKITKVEDI